MQAVYDGNIYTHTYIYIYVFKTTAVQELKKESSYPRVINTLMREIKKNDILDVL